MPAIGNGVDVDVVAVHAVDPGLVELVGIDGLTQVTHHLPQPGRLMLDRHLQQPSLGLATTSAPMCFNP